MTKTHQSTNEKFRGKYRIPSARLKNYDYSSNGTYFITICTKNREHFFGQITDGKMYLSNIGKIIAEEWKKTPEIRENVELGEWVVMPNHVHGILNLNNDRCRRDVLAKRLYKMPKRLYEGEHPKMSQISPTKHSVSNIIKFFKRQTTIRSRTICPDFAWQPRFHDRIVRDENELHRISQYIIANPANWENDDYH